MEKKPYGTQATSAATDSTITTFLALLAILFIAHVLAELILPLVHIDDFIKQIVEVFLMPILCAPWVWILISRHNRAKGVPEQARFSLLSKGIYEVDSSLPALLRVLLALLSILFVAETCIMFALPFLHLGGNPLVENFVDSLLLAILCAPFIWILISRRQRAEEELAASEDSLRLIYNSVHDAIFIHALNGDIVEINDKMLELYGVSREQAITLSFRDDYSSRDNSLEQLQHLWERVKAGENQLFEWKARRPHDGFVFDVEIFLSKIILKGRDMILATVRDITARRQMEQALQTERQRLFSVLENLPGFVNLKAPDYSISFTNRYFRECFGEVDGRPCYQVIGGRNRPCEPCPTHQVFMDKEPRVWEWQDRNNRTFQVHNHPITDVDGSPLVLGLGIDITERKRAEETFNESPQYLSDIIQFFPDATMVIDRQGKVTAWNRAMEELSGVKAEEMLGKGDFEYALPFYNKRRPILIDLVTLPEQELKGKYPRIERRGNTLFAEAYIHNVRGNGLYVHGTAAVLRNPHGEIVGAIESIRDLTKRKRDEEELVFKNIILTTQQEVSPDGILVVDEGGVIISYNRRFIDMWGIPPELVEAGEDALILEFAATKPSDKEGFLARINYLYEHRDEKSREEVALKDGKVFDRYSAPMVDIDGKYCGRVWYFHDITEEKRAEQEIRILNEELGRKVEEKSKQLLAAREELVRKEKLSILGQLCGSVGHELRNPLGVMSNAVYFLKMVHADGDEITREYLDLVKHEIDNSQRIISDLLDFARTKTPRVQMVPARTLINNSLSKCVIPDNIELQIELPDTLPLLRIDPLQMVQVFQNLITNAIQAMPDGGSIRLSAQQPAEKKIAHATPASDNRTGASLLDPNDFIEIAVADTGGGVSPENMKNLFQPLFTTKAKGIGLGLVVCRNLTEANGGTIEARSQYGTGTVFTVRFPRAIEEPVF